MLDVLVGCTTGNEEGDAAVAGTNLDAGTIRTQNPGRRQKPRGGKERLSKASREENEKKRKGKSDVKGRT